MSNRCTYLCVMEIKELEKAIRSSGLRPADIVRMTYGDIKLSQASAWLLDTTKMSASTKHLLIRLCNEKCGVNKEIFQPVGFGNVDTKKVAPKMKRAVMDKLVPESQSVEVVPGQKIPANRPIPSAIDRGASYDDSVNMKYKVLPNGNVKFSCDGRWWEIGKGIDKFSAGHTILDMSLLTPI